MIKNLIFTILLLFYFVGATTALSSTSQNDVADGLASRQSQQTTARNIGRIEIEQTPIPTAVKLNARTGIQQTKVKCQNAQHCVTLINKRITKYWVLPARNVGLKTILIIEIGKQGYIGLIKINKSSGDRLYDDSVISAVRKAAPYTEISSLSDQEIMEFESLKLVFKR